MAKYTVIRIRQPRRDVHLERRLIWLCAESARLNGRWPIKLGLQLALASYRTFRERGHGDRRHAAWRFLQVASELLAQIEKAQP